MSTTPFTDRQTMNAPFFEFFHYLDQTPPEVDFHVHDFYEVFFFISGDVDYIVEGRSYHLQPGDLLLTNSMDIHRPLIRPGKPYERYVLWVNDRFIQNSAEVGDDLTACFEDANHKQYKLVRPDPPTRQHLINQCTRILDAQRSTKFGARNLLYGAVNNFVVYLNRAYFATPESIRWDVIENPVVNGVVAYIDASFTQPLSLEQLEKMFHLTRYHLSRKFKDFTGLSIYQFIMKKRLAHARDLLRSGSSVMEACFDSGFGDYSNFLKAFKREFQCSPRDFARIIPE
ncbi:MAG: helix-turn-helix domain-containing protein [Blautia sp.]|nr:helix-turn-helix domain-containing protein [Blautia sp.]